MRFKKNILLLAGLFAIAFVFSCSSDNASNGNEPSSESMENGSSSSIKEKSSSSIAGNLSSSSEIIISTSSSSSSENVSSSSYVINIPSSSSNEYISSSSEIQSSSSVVQSSSSEIAQISSSSSKVVSSSSEATSGTFTDERNYNKEYKWIKIGEQVWMAQNLNYSTRSVLGGGDPPCYSENTGNCDIYGRLYGPTAKTACPVGWHLPTKAEWQTLVDFIGEDAGKKLKATSGWNSGNGTDEYGFAALPGGYMKLTGYENIGAVGYWWSSDEDDDERGHVWEIGAGNGISQNLNPQFVQRHYSIRCLKN
jgi:uncharacterized protein (TIGR02145 family)